MGGLPISAPVSSEPIDELRSSIAGRKEQIAEAEKRRESAIASSEAIRAPLREKQSAAMQAELEATKAPLPTLKEAARPIPPDVRIPLDKLFSMIMVAAFASSAAGKKNYIAAAAGLTGALEGIQKGQKDATATALKQYDQAMKAALAEDQKNLQRYNAIMAQRNKTIQEKMTEAKMYATEIQNEVHRSQLETGQIDRFIQNTNNSVDTMQREIARLQSQAQIAAQRSEDARARQAQRLSQQKELKGIREAISFDKSIQSLGPALRNIASNYPEGTEKTLVGANPTEKNKIIGAYRAVQESERVADYIARNPIAVGALAAAKNIIRLDSIRSISGDSDASTANQKSANLDSQLDNAVKKGQITEDSAQKAKVLSKMLFALALADVQGSGQRGSVYLDRAFQQLYDQSSRPETLLRIIKERAEENNRNLDDVFGLGVQRHRQPEKFGIVLQDVNKYMKDRAPIASRQDVIDTANAMKITPEQAKKRLRDKGYRIEGEQ